MDITSSMDKHVKHKQLATHINLKTLEVPLLETIHKNVEQSCIRKSQPSTDYTFKPHG